MYSWLNAQGQTIKTKTIGEFVQLTGFRPSNAKSLACAHYLSLNGWVSGHRRAARKRKRWSTVLINTKTNERCVLGPSVTAFARNHNVCKGDVYKLVNQRKLCVKGWMLESTLKLTQGSVAEECFEKKPVDFPIKGTKSHPSFRDATVGIVERSGGHLSEHPIAVEQIRRTFLRATWQPMRVATP